MPKTCVLTYAARSLLALERIETRQCNIKARQSHRQRRILNALRQVEGAGKRQPYPLESFGISHTRRTRALRVVLRIVHTRQVIALVVGGSEIHTGRKTLRRISFGILTMRPLDFETGGL